MNIQESKEKLKILIENIETVNISKRMKIYLKNRYISLVSFIDGNDYDHVINNIYSFNDDLSKYIADCNKSYDDEQEKISCIKYGVIPTVYTDFFHNKYGPEGLLGYDQDHIIYNKEFKKDLEEHIVKLQENCRNLEYLVKVTEKLFSFNNLLNKAVLDHIATESHPNGIILKIK